MKIQAKCPHCGGVIQLDPAVIMGKMPKTMTDAAKEQRRQAVNKRWDEWRKNNPDKVKPKKS